MQQRVEILKMLYRDNEILIFDEPTAVLTPQEIDELMDIMRGFKAEGKSILFITHKLNEIMAVADRCTSCARASTSARWTSRIPPRGAFHMMVGRDVQLPGQKKPCTSPRRAFWKWKTLTVPQPGAQEQRRERRQSFKVRAGEIVCIAGIDGNGQTEFVYGLTGLEKPCPGGKMMLDGKDITTPPSASAPRRHEPHPGGPPQARPGAGFTRWSTTWCCSATGSRSSRTTASSRPLCASTPTA